MKRRTPDLLLASGILLGAIMVAEVLAIATFRYQFNIPAVANLITSIPFVIVLLWGGHWLSRSDLQPERYPRIAMWTIAGTAFIGTFFGIIAVSTQTALLAQIGVVRWGIVAGAGAGALVGLFEARAINRALDAERTRIRYDELQRQTDRLEGLIDIISHDLRNPLNVASGNIELLDEKYSDERFERVASAHDRMYVIIEDMLRLARSGQLISETEPINISDLVRQCWANVETEGATLDYVGESIEIQTDPNRVQHLFENLMRNAIEHGGANVTVRVGTLPGGFYLEDEGVGIPSEKRDVVFESGYSSKQDGTGFGLPIVSEIAEAHGWVVTLTSGTDGGARFEFTDVDVKELPAQASSQTQLSGSGIP